MAASSRHFFVVCQAWRVARKSHLTGCGGQPSDLEVEAHYIAGEGSIS